MTHHRRLHKTGTEGSVLCHAKATTYGPLQFVADWDQVTCKRCLEIKRANKFKKVAE